MISRGDSRAANHNGRYIAPIRANKTARTRSIQSIRRLGGFCPTDVESPTRTSHCLRFPTADPPRGLSGRNVRRCPGWISSEGWVIPGAILTSSSAASIRSTAVRGGSVVGMGARDSATPRRDSPTSSAQPKRSGLGCVSGTVRYQGEPIREGRILTVGEMNPPRQPGGIRMSGNAAPSRGGDRTAVPEPTWPTTGSTRPSRCPR